MPTAKELPAEAFVSSVIDLLVSSGQSFTLSHAKKLLNRSIAKLPHGKAKAAAQEQLPVLKRLLKRKLQDIRPEHEELKHSVLSVGSVGAFSSAITSRDKVSTLLHARVAAHPELLKRVLNLQEGKAFDQGAIHLVASSEGPDMGHILIHVCCRYNTELRQMADLCFSSNSQGPARNSAHALCVFDAASVNACGQRLEEISQALRSLVALCPIHCSTRDQAHFILRNSCQPPLHPIATVLYTAAAVDAQAHLQSLAGPGIAVRQLRQIVSDVEQKIHRLHAGLQTHMITVVNFLLQHPVAAVDSCITSQPWACVPCIAWLALFNVVRIHHLEVKPLMTVADVLLYRRCRQVHVCLGDRGACEKAALAFSGRSCSAAACTWVAGLQRPKRLIEACHRQHSHQSADLGNFLMNYPHEEDIALVLQQLLTHCEVDTVVESPGTADAGAELDDDNLFVMDTQANPVFSGNWNIPDDSEASGDDSDQEEGSGDIEFAEDGAIPGSSAQ